MFLNGFDGKVVLELGNRFPDLTQRFLTLSKGGYSGSQLYIGENIRGLSINESVTVDVDESVLAFDSWEKFDLLMVMNPTTGTITSTKGGQFVICLFPADLPSGLLVKVGRVSNGFMLLHQLVNLVDQKKIASTSVTIKKFVMDESGIHLNHLRTEAIEKMSIYKSMVRTALMSKAQGQALEFRKKTEMENENEKLRKQLKEKDEANQHFHTLLSTQGSGNISRQSRSHSHASTPKKRAHDQLAPRSSSSPPDTRKATKSTYKA